MRNKDSQKRKEASLCVGRNPVKELLRKAPHRITSLLLVPQILREAEISALLKEHNIPFEETSSRELDALCPDARHQGVVAFLGEREPLSLNEFLKKLSKEGPSLLIMLDEVTDPHNVGAILRAAECFGAEGVVYSRNRIASLSSVVSKSSAGALDLITLCEVGNLAQSLEKFKEAGYWGIAANVSDRSELLSTFAFPERTLLVLGAEGKGVQRLLRERCDFELEIPMYGQIDSLNVSQAAAVLLAQYRFSQSKIQQSLTQR